MENDNKNRVRPKNEKIDFLDAEKLELLKKKSDCKG